MEIQLSFLYDLPKTNTVYKFTKQQMQLDLICPSSFNIKPDFLDMSQNTARLTFH